MKGLIAEIDSSVRRRNAGRWGVEFPLRPRPRASHRLVGPASRPGALTHAGQRNGHGPNPRRRAHLPATGRHPGDLSGTPLPLEPPEPVRGNGRAGSLPDLYFRSRVLQTEQRSLTPFPFFFCRIEKRDRLGRTSADVRERLRGNWSVQGNLPSEFSGALLYQRWVLMRVVKGPENSWCS